MKSRRHDWGVLESVCSPQPLPLTGPCRAHKDVLTCSILCHVFSPKRAQVYKYIGMFLEVMVSWV